MPATTDLSMRITSGERLPNCLVFTFLLIPSHMGKLRLRMTCKLNSIAYSFEIQSPGPLAPIFVRMSSTHKGPVAMAQVLTFPMVLVVALLFQY